MHARDANDAARYCRLDGPCGTCGSCCQITSLLLGSKPGWLVHAGCAAYTVILACGGVLVPYYAITYKGGLASGRHAPFGRISRGHILSTVRAQYVHDDNA